MSEAVDVTQRCTFSPAIDVTAVLDRLEVQFLDVHERRAIVIFAGAILNLECLEGELTALETGAVTVYDLPVDGPRDGVTEDEAANELIEEFEQQLVTAARSA
ncbi:hypothetical protein [Natronolimnohabitans innermongolicus]|uniref:Uncharacterized protein n=1 Tax=Natronolimnohabitans innermongolicus JCM 12255 TaxID=1227499 RepID=L9WP37_9EURY|nr:hypothetical protein [Natronolimnohabitans innermongolicus]ELY50971.1 hypothetical protein C493_18336 [Natronolimnohabitans innermongolicus JCM 12255]